MKKLLLLPYLLFHISYLSFSQNIGIGTTNPQAKLDVRGTIAMNDNLIYLRAGSDLSHGLKYLSTVGGPYLFGYDGGALGTVDLPHSLTWDFLGNVNVKSNFQSGDGITIDTASANNGSLINALRFGGGNTGEGIGSKRTTTGNQYGLDFYTAFITRLSITNSGTVQVINNLTVQNGKGIIRSNDGTQQKKVIKDVLVNVTIAAGASTAIGFTFPESFSAAPDTYIGNVVSGGGGWAEVIMSLSNISSTGGFLYINNPRSTSWSPNFTIRIIAIGPQ